MSACVCGRVGAQVDGGGLSTDLDTITKLSCLLPHQFWTRIRFTTGNKKAQLSSRRFGQSGIKCRALFSHSALGVGTPGDLHCAFSHTSLGGALGISSLRKESVQRERHKCKERDGESSHKRWSNLDGEKEVKYRSGG